MSEEIVNKVAASGLITLNLEEFKAAGERVLYDIKQNLFQEIILKEKDFRAFTKVKMLPSFAPAMPLCPPGLTCSWLL